MSTRVSGRDRGGRHQRRTVTADARLIVAGALAFVAAGCGATLVSSPARSLPGLPPAPQVGVVQGVVQYEETIVRAISTRRQADAARRMTAACGGSFRVEREEVVRGRVALIPVGNVFLPVRSNVRQVTCSCLASGDSTIARR